MKTKNTAVSQNKLRAVLAIALGIYFLTACSERSEVEQRPSPEIPTAEAGISVSSSSFTPIVRAPSDTRIALTETLNLAGSVSSASIPISIPIIQWVKKVGPGSANFLDSSKASTSVRFDLPGSYLLELQVIDGENLFVDQVQIIVESVVLNQAPLVSVGENFSISIDAVTNLSAEISDDNLPNDTLNGVWQKVYGPGEATFGEASSPNTTVTFNAIGSYRIQYTVSDGELDSSDELEIEVGDAPQVSNPEVLINGANQWEEVVTSDGSAVQQRHEAAGIAFQDNMYALGGRGIKQIDRYDSQRNIWENLGGPAIEMSHFQPVVYDGKIYVIGALDCCYPSENIVPEIQIFNLATSEWAVGATLPSNRKRGSGGLVVHNGKFYLVAGSTNGHNGGMVSWFDEYDPETDSWKTLPDAPTQRDHFTAAMVGNKLVLAGGRATDHPDTFLNLIGTVDIYDFDTGQWSSGTPIPTRRAGAMTVSYGDEVILIGGEAVNVPALSVVEAYNVKTDTWRTLNPLITARHSGSAAIVNGAIHVVSGNLTRGGGNETDAHEKLELQ